MSQAYSAEITHEDDKLEFRVKLNGDIKTFESFKDAINRKLIRARNASNAKQLQIPEI